MWRHLRERRAAPKHSSTWSQRLWAYPRCRFQKCNRAATVGELIRRLRRWTAAVVILETLAPRGSPTRALDPLLLFTLLIRRARGIPMIRPAARSKTRPLPSSTSARPELLTRRRLNQSQRLLLSPSWWRMSLRAAATSGGHLISLTVWRPVSRLKPSRCRAISPLTSKWM